MLLQRDAQGGHDAITNRMLAAIGAMKTMTDGLLSADSLTAPSPAGRQAIGAGTLAENALDMMNPIAERSGITLVLGEIPKAELRIDYAQMLRVMGNLLGNAIKFSPAGNAVMVQGARAGDILSLAVVDNGKGMTVDEQTHVFDKGWQGAEGMVRGDGAGLGLSIVKALVEQNGGRVQVTSDIGRGSSVTVSLPCS